VSKIRKERIQIETAKTLIRNGGDCSKVNCKNCYYYHYLHQCIEFGHAADRYENHPELVIKKQKEFLAQTEYKDTYEINSCPCFKQRLHKYRFCPKLAIRVVDISSKFDVSIYRNRKFRKPEIIEEFNEIEFCPYCGKEIEVKEKII